MAHKMKCVALQGSLQVGSGKESPLMNATVVNPYGDENKVEVLLSADDRHIWLKLDAASAVALANRLLDPQGVNA